MPNWCINTVTLRHKDPAMIERLVNGSAHLLNEFIPCPSELHEHHSPTGDEERAERFTKLYGAPDWYHWQINNWGTKWDVSLEDIHRPDSNTVEGCFESAWSPPIEAYRKLEDMGFEVEAYYNEPGIAFFGSYIDGREDTIDYGGMDAETIRKEFPDLDERFGVSDWIEDSQDFDDVEENLEIDLDGGLSAVNEQDKE